MQQRVGHYYLELRSILKDMPSSHTCPHPTHSHLPLTPTSHSLPPPTHSHIPLTPTSHSLPHLTHSHTPLTPSPPQYFLTQSDNINHLQDSGMHLHCCSDRTYKLGSQKMALVLLLYLLNFDKLIRI